jgi:hypothetical protein
LLALGADEVLRLENDGGVFEDAAVWDGVRGREALGNETLRGKSRRDGGHDDYDEQHDEYESDRALHLSFLQSVLRIFCCGKKIFFAKRSFSPKRSFFREYMSRTKQRCA